MSNSVMESQLRQNFHREWMAAINQMVNLELYASYVYLSMVSAGCMLNGLKQKRF